jgi:hypothetical protein
MLKSSLAAALIVGTIAFGSAGASAQTYPQPNTPVATPQSSAHQQAQVTNDPAACGKIATRSWNNAGLHVQQQSPGTAREVAKQLLLAARNFAATGDEALCWHWYDRYEQVR